MDSSEEAYGWVDITPFFDLQGAFPRMCSQQVLLDLENEKYMVSYLLSG